jgi:hypothetical protein
MNLPRLSAIAIVVVIASSLWLAVKVGSTPVMKLALFLFGLSIWYGILTYVRELLEKPKGV